MSKKRTRIKIRFIQDGSRYLIQQKHWYGWRYICYLSGASNGDYVRHVYEGQSTDPLLDKVLKEHFNTSRTFISITEYPMLRYY